VYNEPTLKALHLVRISAILDYPMEVFFGFDTKYTEVYDVWFNGNHLLLVLIAIGTIAALYFGLHAKSKKGIIITKIVLASVLATFELGRYIYYYFYNAHLGIGFDWLGMIPFSMCGIMSITTSVILFVSAFKKKQGPTMQLFFNILFGCALWGGVLTFAFPSMLTLDRSLFHWLNFQTIIVHILLILVPAYLVKIGDLEVRLRNIWMVSIGYLAIGIITMTGSQITGDNFANALVIDMVQGWNISIPFPWHLPPLLAAMLVVPTIYYALFELVHRRKNKQAKKPDVFINKKYNTLCLISLIGGYAASVALLLLIPSLFNAVPVGNALGLLCLIPLAVLAASLIAGRKFRKAALKVDVGGKQV